VANANINVYTSGFQLIGTAVTDSTGAYSVEAGSGTVHVRASRGFPASPHAPQSWTAWRQNLAVAGVTTVNFTLPVAKVTGQVKREDGNAVANATVEAFGSSSDSTTSFDGSGSAVADTSGNYALLLIGGQNNFVVRPPAGTGLTPLSTSFAVSGDTARDFVLSPAVMISGTVLGYGGNAVASANINVYTSGFQLIGTAVTDSNGAYSVEAGSGTVHVRASRGFPASPHAPQNWTAWRQNLAISGAMAIDFTLPLARVEGMVTDSNGAPVPSVNVEGFSSNADHTTSYDGSSSVASDATGRYTMLFFRSSANFIVRPPNLSGFSPTQFNTNLQGDLTQRIVLQRPDLSPPQITAGPFVVHLSDTSVSISWTTNEASTSLVKYGLGALGQTASVPGLTTNHTVTLMNLNPVSTYSYQVGSVDEVGNGPTYSGVGTFITQAPPGDITPPVITSGPTVVFIDQTSAIVQWTTDEPANSVLEYGLSEALGTLVGSPADVFTQTHSLTLTGLSPSTTYHARVTTSDPDGNSTTGSVFRLTTLDVPDTSAPVITSGPSIESVTDTGMVVVWQTDEPATSGVSFNDGVTFDVISDSTLTKSHRMTLSGLMPATLYNITVSSIDAVGNGPTLGGPIVETTAPTPDTVPPIISAIQVLEISTHSAVVSWTTNELSTSTVHYGTTAGALDNSRTELTPALEHSMMLTGLLDGTTYYFVVSSTDASGNWADSSEQSFTTESAFVDQPPTPPGPITAPDRPTSAQSFDITWGASTDDVGLTGYEVLRSGSVIGFVGPNITSFVESGVPEGSYTYQIRAIDTAGHASVSAEVSVVVDRTPPQITVPADFEVTATGRLTPVVYEASAFDGVDGAVAVSCTPPSGGTFTTGPTDVLCTAIDIAKNESKAPFRASVVDKTPPVVSVPADMLLEATSPQGAVAVFTATANDQVDGLLTPECIPAPGSWFALGVHEVTCTATDAAGNVGTERFNVTVIDSTAPVISSVAPSEAILWPPNHMMRELSLKVAVADIADGSPRCEVSEISSNEPVEGTGDGDMAPDWATGLGLTYWLRAERSGTGGGRVYTIAVKCRDASNNWSTAKGAVQVPHGQESK
jgi:protocatechuate 3,4-dioxygenase beta subunit